MGRLPYGGLFICMTSQHFFLLLVRLLSHINAFLFNILLLLFGMLSLKPRIWPNYIFIFSQIYKVISNITNFIFNVLFPIWLNKTFWLKTWASMKRLRYFRSLLKFMKNTTKRQYRKPCSFSCAMYDKKITFTRRVWQLTYRFYRK